MYKRQAQLLHLSADDVVEGLPLALQVLKVLPPGVGGAHQDEEALAAFLHVGEVGGNAVEPHVGAEGDEVGLEGAGEVGLGVHLGGLGDVAPLDVGNGDQLPLPQVGQGVLVGAQPVKPQGLVIRCV